MAKNITKELERAILEMPQKEKDKILLRLIDKNAILVEQLHYRLLEDDGFDLQVRKDKARASIRYYAGLGSSKYPKFVLKHLRAANSAITHFKRITGDKVGEIELYLELLTAALNTHTFILSYTLYHPEFDAIRMYLCNKLANVLKLIDKVHEDYRIEFAKSMDEVLEKMQADGMKKITKEFNFPTDFEA
jgi:hypothetical protein